MREKPQVRVEPAAAGAATIHLENRLKARLARPSGLTLDEMTRRADQAMARAASELAPALETHIRELERLCDGASAPLAERLRGLRRHAHELRGMGGMLGFPLLTAAGASLFGLIERLSANVGTAALAPAHEAAITAHVRKMREVWSRRMTGSGGEAGARLIEGLQAIAAEASL